MKHGDKVYCEPFTGSRGYVLVPTEDAPAIVIAVYDTDLILRGANGRVYLVSHDKVKPWEERPEKEKTE